MQHHGSIIAQAVVLNEGLLAGTTIMTLAGAVAVERIKVGDRVITRSGARAVRDVQNLLLPSAKLVRIAASALGTDQPAEDMHVAFDQGLHIHDWRAKALRGVDQAIILAKDLLDGEYIRAQTVICASLYRLAFDKPEIIFANGVEVTCTP
jgi:hypothetical protein